MAAINHPLGQRRRGIPIPLPGSPNWWVLGAMAIVGFSAMLPVLQSSWTTTRGFETQDLEARQAQLSGDIRTLESEVAKLTSLTRIERRALAMGLVPGGTPLYVTVDEAGPAPAQIPSELLPELERESDEPDSLWRSLISRVPLLD
jgi:hypothetical protein